MTSTRLPRLLSLLPRDGVSSSVYQTRWASKGLPVPSSNAAERATCRWEVKKVKLDLAAGEEGKGVTGRAWGVMYWKGQRVTPMDKEYEPIAGALKYDWSAAVAPPMLVKRPSAPAAAEQVAAE